MASAVWRGTVDLPDAEAGAPVLRVAAPLAVGVRFCLICHSRRALAAYRAIRAVSWACSATRTVNWPPVVGHSLGAAVAAVFAAFNPASAVVCVDQTLRWGDFAPLVQARERELRGAQPMEAVLAIDRELGLGTYQDAVFERRVREFSPEVVLGIWSAMLTTPVGARKTAYVMRQ